MNTKRQEISECAAYLFRKKGYRATSMRDIARAAAIKAASIYNHFDSKQEILSSLLLKMARLFTNGMEEVRNSDEGPLRQLELLIDLHVRLTVEHTDAIALIAGEWIHLEEPAKGTYLAMRNSYEERFRSIMEAGKKKGVLQDVDTDVALFCLLSALRLLYSWYSRHRNYDTGELKKQISLIMLNGIKY